MSLIICDMKEDGVTLLEILVAAIIMALVMAGIANIFIAGKKHIFHSRFRMTGSELGRLFVDPLAMDVRQDKWDQNCLSAGLGCPGGDSVDNMQYTTAYAISDVAGTDLKKAKVTITWDESTLY